MRLGTFVVTVIFFVQRATLFFVLVGAVVATLGYAWLKDDPSTCSWPTVMGDVHQVCGTRAQRRLMIEGYEREWCEDVGPRFCNSGAR